jgi:hypothetical protein
MDLADDHHQTRAPSVERPQPASGEGLAPRPSPPHPLPASAPGPSLLDQLTSAAVAAPLLAAAPLAGGAAAAEALSGCESMED